MIIYIAGPYSGDPEANTKAAIQAAQKLVEGNESLVPFIPHLTHYWDKLYKHTYEWWLQYDLQFLARSDALLRLPGVSKGADREVMFALGRGLPIYRSVEEAIHNIPINSIEQVF